MFCSNGRHRSVFSQKCMIRSSRQNRIWFWCKIIALILLSDRHFSQEKEIYRVEFNVKTGGVFSKIFIPHILHFQTRGRDTNKNSNYIQDYITDKIIVVCTKQFFSLPKNMITIRL